MSLKDKASLIFKPSRYKAGTAYSFRGPDLSHARGSVGTRYNSSGLIESVAVNTPRLNYDPYDLTKEPTLLVERQSTNHFPYSNDFTQADWLKDKVTIVPNVATSPDGTNNASLMYVNTTGSAAYLYDSLSVGTTSSYTISAYVKSAGRQICWIYIDSGAGYGTAYFDLSKKTISISSGSTSTLTAKMTELSDGWFRIEATTGSQITLGGGSGIGISDSNSLAATVNGTNGIYIYGLQIEPTTGATSLINTSGAAATRSAEASNTTDLQASRIVGASAGTFLVEVEKKNHPIFLNQKITLSGSSTNASLLIDNISGAVRVRIWNNSSSNVGTITTGEFPSGRVKYLIKWNGTTTSVFANGIFVGSANVPNYAYAIYDVYEQTSFSMNELAQVFFAPVALSDADCIALTSFDDYEELVDAKVLTWESPTATNNRLTALSEL